MTEKEAEEAIKALDNLFKIVPKESSFEELLTWNECLRIKGLSNLKLLEWLITGKVKSYFKKSEILNQLKL